jgi:apolipoprotein N-acyltransferase
MSVFCSLRDSIRSYRLTLAGAIFAGFIAPFSLAPFDIWPLAIISLSLLALSLNQLNSGKALLAHAYAFGLAYYGVGVSWVFISIYYFGDTSFLLSIILTSLFILFIALLFALPFYGLQWLHSRWRLLLGFPLAWLLSEWLRTWLLTGFPWLYIGYSHTDTWLAGWAPVGGVLLLTLWSCLTSSYLSSCYCRQLSLHQGIAIGLALGVAWVAGYHLKSIQWTEVAGEPISVGIVQPNIPQDKRWLPEYRPVIQEQLTTLSQPLWQQDWLIWPEAAIPHVYHNSWDFLEKTQLIAEQYNSVVITGVLYDQVTEQGDTRYYNSIIGIGNVAGIYHKRRLVPFGEYVPMENLVRGLINFFDLPFSVISSGSPNQQNLRIGDYWLANAICYEIAYPSLVSEQTRGAHVLLTVSNDAWFGRSIGPLQHFQMVRMRAQETGRFIIRSTNNGISAIIGPDGYVRKASPQFVATNLSGQVIPMKGSTPFMIWGNYPLLIILALVGLFLWRRADANH